MAKLEMKSEDIVFLTAEEEDGPITSLRPELRL